MLIVRMHLYDIITHTCSSPAIQLNHIWRMITSHSTLIILWLVNTLISLINYVKNFSTNQKVPVLPPLDSFRVFGIGTTLYHLPGSEGWLGLQLTPTRWCIYFPILLCTCADPIQTWPTSHALLKTISHHQLASSPMQMMLNWYFPNGREPNKVTSQGIQEIRSSLGKYMEYIYVHVRIYTVHQFIRFLGKSCSIWHC